MINLLENPSFENGYIHQNDTPELAIPHGWHFWYQSQNALRLEHQDDDWFRPECAVWRKQDAPPNEQGLFFLDDSNYCFKVFKDSGPTWFKLSQTVTGLIPDARYRFAAPIFPDLVMGYSGSEKQFADDPLAGEHRLYAGTTDTGWLDGDVVQFGQYNRLYAEFTAPPSGTATVAVEVRGRWGLKNNGWFFDNFSLVRVDEAPEPPPVTPTLPTTPAPTPVPDPDPIYNPTLRCFFALGIADVTSGDFGQLDILERFDTAFGEALAKVGIVLQRR